MHSRGLSLLYMRLELAVEEYKRNIVGHSNFKNIVSYSSDEAERYIRARESILKCEKLMDFIYKLDNELSDEMLIDMPLDLWIETRGVE